MASTISTLTVICFRRMYEIPDHIKMSAPSPNDKVTSGPKGRIAIYEAFLQAGFCLPFHPFILTLLDQYRLVPAQLTSNSFRTICSSVLCHFHKIVPRFSLFRSIFILKRHATEKRWTTTSRQGTIYFDLPSLKVRRVDFSIFLEGINWI